MRVAQPAIPSLRWNFAWTLSGNVVYAGCQWGMLVVLAKLGSPEMVGQFALGLAVTAPVFMLSNLQLRAVQATDASGEFRFGDYLALRLVTTALALPVIVGFVVLGGYRVETALVVLAIGLAKAVESISDVFYGLFQQQEEMSRVAKSLLLRGPLSLAALGLGVYLTGNVLWGAVGLALAWGLVLFGYDVRDGVRLLGAGSWKAAWKPATLRRLARLALPLGVVMMLISLNTNIPRYFVERYLGEATLGVFAALASLGVPGSTAVGALGQSASHRLARLYAAQNHERFRRLLGKLLSVAASIGVTGVLIAISAGEELLAIVYGQIYSTEPEAFIWIMLAAGISYAGSIMGYAITATRSFDRFVVPYSIVPMVTLVASSLVVPTHGIIGATWVMCVVASLTVLVPVILLVMLRREEQ